MDILPPVEMALAVIDTIYWRRSLPFTSYRALVYNVLQMEWGERSVGYSLFDIRRRRRRSVYVIAYYIDAIEGSVQYIYMYMRSGASRAVE